jgi:hypothetical protein
MILSVADRKAALRRIRALVGSRFAELVKSRGFERRRGSVRLYRFRRKSAERHDLLEVQFDRYMRPRFIVNFGTVSSDGLVDGYGRNLAADDVQIVHLPVSGRLNACPRLLLEYWFGVGWVTIGSAERAAELQIDKLTRLFPHVEHWFATGRAGLRLAVRNEPQKAPGSRKKFMQEKGIWPPPGWTEENNERSDLLHGGRDIF